MKIKWRIVIPIFGIQALIGIAEAWDLVRCHTSTAECWPWFFSFTVNVPASLLFVPLQRACEQYLSFYPALVVECVFFVALGTVWWSGLIHLTAWLISSLRSQPQGPNA